MRRADWELHEPKQGFTEEEEDIVFKMMVAMPIEIKKEKKDS
jgi:hypothetical protein